MHSPQLDEEFSRRALDLARAGIGLTSPNPNVGALLVNDAGEIVGSGTYTYDGVKHAEILAIEQAGASARGATLYINLEPCSHQGRTPPCADAVIAAGITRVVAAMEDPNPLVAGKGFAKLRAAGIQVETGLLEPEARKLNEAFANYIRRKRPLITLKSAMTLDGKIAPPPGPAQLRNSATDAWITGEQARAHVQTLRHESDAILVGIGTVLADDPLLTDRSGLPRRRPLLRVILDSRLRIPFDSRLVQSAENDVLVVCSCADAQEQKALKAHGIRVLKVSSTHSDGRPDFSAILQQLGQLEITSLIIEGGATVNGAALGAGVVDKVFLYYAPKFLGGSAVPFSFGEAFSMSNRLDVTSIELHRFGQDIAIEGYLRDPYGGTEGN